MTSKTFKSVLGTTELEVSEYADSHAGLFVSDEDGEELSGFYFDPSTAPALALAILEAAGHRPVAYDPERLSGDDLLAYIAHRLAVHVGDEAKRTAEAEAQAKLEAEALELFNVKHGTDLDDWKYADRSVVSGWVSVARKAREIGAEK